MPLLRKQAGSSGAETVLPGLRNRTEAQRALLPEMRRTDPADPVPARPDFRSTAGHTDSRFKIAENRSANSGSHFKITAGRCSNTSSRFKIAVCRCANAGFRFKIAACRCANAGFHFKIAADRSSNVGSGACPASKCSGKPHSSTAFGCPGFKTRDISFRPQPRPAAAAKLWLRRPVSGSVHPLFHQPVFPGLPALFSHQYSGGSHANPDLCRNVDDLCW